MLSGDEDIREGVAEAQDQGVSVVLVGVPPVDGAGNQALALISEADDHLLLDKAALQKWFSLREIGWAMDGETATPEEEAARSFGEEFGADWGQAADPQALQALLWTRPQLPNELDRRLLDDAQTRFGDLFERPHLRRSLRDGFWLGVDRSRGVTPG